MVLGALSATMFPTWSYAGMAQVTTLENLRKKISNKRLTFQCFEAGECETKTKEEANFYWLVSSTTKSIRSYIFIAQAEAPHLIYWQKVNSSDQNRGVRRCMSTHCSCDMHLDTS